MTKRKHEGYMPHVYNVDKFIGSTNKNTPRQTSYFRNDDTQEFGRITRDHNNPGNVGRNKVESTERYTAENKIVIRKGKPVLRYVESRIKSGVTLEHTSRSSFSPPSPNSTRRAYEDLNKFKDEKPITSKGTSKKVKKRKKGHGM